MELTQYSGLTIEAIWASTGTGSRTRFAEPVRRTVFPVDYTFSLPCGNNGTHGEIASKGGLFLQGSRFNSSCVPNVNNYWNERRQVIGFRALRNIAEGEELCISYTSEMKSRDSRKLMLRKNFGFECHCAACSLSGDELRASDHRRTTLDSLYDEIGKCGSQSAVGIRKVWRTLRNLWYRASNFAP